MTSAAITTIPRTSAESADIERPRDEESARRFDTVLARFAAQSTHVRTVIRAPEKGAEELLTGDKADRASLVGETGNEIADRALERIAREGSLTPIAQQASQQLTEPAGRSPAAQQPTAENQPPVQHQARPEQATPSTSRVEQSTAQAPTQTSARGTPLAAQAQTGSSTNETSPQPAQPSQPEAPQASPNHRPGAEGRQQSNAGQQQSQSKLGSAITASKAGSQPGTAQNQGAFGSSLRRAAQMTRTRVVAPAQKTPFQLDQTKLEAQAARGLAAALKQRGGVVTMRLNPASLGTLTVRVEVRNGVIDAKFEASSGQARDLLNSNLTSLRAALESRGLTVERLSIAEPPAQDAPDRGTVGDDRGSEDPTGRGAEDRPSNHTGEHGAGRATPSAQATDGEHALDDPAGLAPGVREQHESVGGAGIAIRIDTVI